MLCSVLNVRVCKRTDWNLNCSVKVLTINTECNVMATTFYLNMFTSIGINLSEICPGDLKQSDV